jgi:hypothetical protein
MNKSDPKEVTGGCQCGSVRYRIENAKNEASYCHCRMCQRAFGNIFATLLMIKKTDVTWLKNVPDYFESSKLARRGFCSKCGTPLTFEYLDRQSLDISVGSLDRPDLMKPVSHNGVESRIPSFAWPDDLPQNRTEGDERYVAQWREVYGKDSMPGPVTGI